MTPRYRIAHGPSGESIEDCRDACLTNTDEPDEPVDAETARRDEAEYRYDRMRDREDEREDR